MDAAARRAGAPASPALPLLAGLFGYLFGLLAPQILKDGDTYMHVAAGEWMLRHGTVPHVDPFSFTFAGAPWVAHEWLAEVLMALGYRAGSWSGVMALTGIAAGLTLGLLAHHLRRWLDVVPTLAVLALVALCLRPTLLARPHVLALPILELWTAGLLAARHRGGAPSPLLLPLMPLWANLHGGFVFGLALIWPTAIDAVLAGPREDQARRLGRWALFGAAATLLSIATPYGWESLLFPFQVNKLTFLANIDEWKPASFQHVQALEIALIALIAVAFTRPFRLSPARLLTLIGLLHLSLQHNRHQQLAGLVGALLLAEPLGCALAAARKAGPRPSASPIRARALLPAVLAAAAAASVGRWALPAVRENDRISPVGAIAHVPPDLARRPVLNERRFGGYLIFKGIAPFVDGRADMYGDAFLWHDLAIVQDPEALAATLRKYDIAWTIFAPDGKAAALMDRMPGWHRLYADDAAVVHVRDAAAP